MVQAPGGTDGLEFAADRIAMNIHGNADSHLDALCHVAFDGTLYNGVPATVVTAAGATFAHGPMALKACGLVPGRFTGRQPRSILR